MNSNDSVQQDRRKDRVEARLDPEKQWESDAPVIEGGGARYEVCGRVTVLASGGIALIHEMARSIGLPCQVVRAARGLRLRIAMYTPWAGALVDGLDYFRKTCFVA